MFDLRFHRLLLLVGLSFLVGCGGRLSNREAIAVLNDSYKVAAGPRASFPVSFDFLELGTEKKFAGSSDSCNQPEDVPVAIEKWKRYEAAGLITVSKAGCAWHSTATHILTADLPERDRVEAKAGEYIMAMPHLGTFAGFQIDKVKQQGAHAQVKYSAKLAFTETMKRLAAQQEFPDLAGVKIFQGACRYDLPVAEIRCTANADMAYVDKRWILDRSNNSQ